MYFLSILVLPVLCTLGAAAPVLDRIGMERRRIDVGIGSGLWIRNDLFRIRLRIRIRQTLLYPTGSGSTTLHRIPSKTHVQLTSVQYLVVYMSRGLDFDGGKIILEPLEVLGPENLAFFWPKWTLNCIFPHQNIYVLRHINSRYRKLLFLF